MLPEAAPMIVSFNHFDRFITVLFNRGLGNGILNLVSHTGGIQNASGQRGTTEEQASCKLILVNPFY